MRFPRCSPIGAFSPLHRPSGAAGFSPGLSPAMSPAMFSDAAASPAFSALSPASPSYTPASPSASPASPSYSPISPSKSVPEKEPGKPRSVVSDITIYISCSYPSESRSCALRLSGTGMSTSYSPISPAYSPMSPSYSPLSPSYSPLSPSYSPQPSAAGVHIPQESCVQFMSLEAWFAFLKIFSKFFCDLWPLHATYFHLCIARHISHISRHIFHISTSRRIFLSLDFCRCRADRHPHWHPFSAGAGGASGPHFTPHSAASGAIPAGYSPSASSGGKVFSPVGPAGQAGPLSPSYSPASPAFSPVASSYTMGSSGLSTSPAYSPESPSYSPASHRCCCRVVVIVSPRG